MQIIAGTHKNRILSAPKSALTRPTSSRLREAVFNICQNSVDDATFLDLFAGSGAIGLEALSRGAKSALLIDSSKECATCIKKNIEALKLESRATFVCGDVFTMLKKFAANGKQFDLIYADPPYEKQGNFEGKLFSYSEQLLIAIDTLPILTENGYFFLEDITPFSPEKLNLQTLMLVSSRKAGKATLCEFRKR
ncbi:MAG: 16S rRNA (guanine(966)-N(2))-methyltransferase RsmD [Parachlamydiaceae bacterium]|nr:16S rRNA (guanine(966)-N(2))-methyltransferase RsmD [Parachlamydiaceae bacterium]